MGQPENRLCNLSPEMKAPHSRSDVVSFGYFLIFQRDDDYSVPASTYHAFVTIRGCFQPLNFGTICYKVKVNQNGEKWEKLLLWVDKLDNGALTLAQNFPECIPLLPSLGFLIQGCSLHSQKW